MKNDQNHDTKMSSLDQEIAHDVARLFTWANIGEAPYREFSRERKTRAVQIAQTPHPIEETAPNGGAQNSISQAGTASAVVSSAATSSSFQRPVPQERTSQAPVSGACPPVTSVEDPVSQDPLVVPRKAGRAATYEQEPSPRIQELSHALAIFSIAGGVGKTTLCANLGKTLCALGEQTLLVDASGRQLLPFYFGATELRPGLRTFAAPGQDSPSIQVIGAHGDVGPRWLEAEVKRVMAPSQRAIFDIGPSCAGLLSEVLSLCAVVLVPLLPDLNSLLTVPHIEAAIKSAQSGSSKNATIFYIFNRFDEQSANDQCAWEFVAPQCGKRLLPITIRRSMEMAEALHAGIAAADYAPGPGAAHDYLEVALWLRKVAPLSAPGLLSGRWSER